MIVNIFEHYISIVDSVYELRFKSLGFEFMLSLSNFKLKMPFKVYNVMFTCNDMLYVSMAVTEQFLVDNTSKLEIVLMKELFSNRSVKDLMLNIEKI